MPHVLLIIPTSTYRAPAFLQAAEALDLEVSVASEQPLPLVNPDRYIQIDCGRTEWSARQLIDFAVSRPIDAIIPVDDQGVVITALAAQELHLTHNPPAAAAATRNKLMLRQALWDAEVPQTHFGLAQADQAARVAYRVGYPVVVKPLSRSGGQGVIRADNRSEIIAAEEEIRRILAQAGVDPQQPLLVERFQSGPEIAIEGLLEKRQLQVLAVFDKPDPLEGPAFEETILVTPSRLHPEVQDEAVATARRAVQGLGLSHGAVHIELRVTDGHPWVVEVASRSIGGQCSKALRFGLGQESLETLLLRNALSLPPPSIPGQPSARSSGVMMIPVPQPGLLGKVSGLETAKQVPGITGIEIAIPEGGYAAAPPQGDRYLGFIFAAADRPAQVEEALREAHQRLTIPIESP